jgi:copper transport protein
VLLRTLVAGELALALGILVAAATLTSLPPPSQALAKEGSAAARVGPGAVRRVLTAHGYRLELRVDPNRAALPNTFELRLSRAGRPVRGADVVARFDMLDMDMSPQAYTLPERGAGRYARSAPALVMVGHWAVTFDVRPRAGAPFQVIVVDRAAG